MNWLKVSLLLILVAVAALILTGNIHLSLDLGRNDQSAHAAPPVPPAEFLYLDSGRVGSYLAQLDNGIYSDEKQREKVTNAVHAAVHFGEAIEGGASSEEEGLVERQVTATAASSYFSLKALLSLLPRREWLAGVQLGHEQGEKRLESLHAGQFIFFRTNNLARPTYLDPYLAIRRPHGLRELFPAGGERTHTQRITSVTRRLTHKFEGEIGKNPRIVLSLTNTSPSSRHIAYLLPMSAALVTEERSLLSEGGGELKVLGKVARVFTQRRQKPVYVDEATLQTWRGPIRHAPGALICRTDSSCAAREQDNRLIGPARRGAIRSARRRDLRSLDQQTEIGKFGAVILPLAIYK